MIDAKEIRLGNHVKYAEPRLSKHIRFSNALRKKYAGMIIIIDVDINMQILQYHYRFDPVPITPEVLEACGFEKNNNYWKHGETFFIRIEEHGSWVNGSPVEPIKYIAYKSGIGAIVELIDLHQLQNLYFALTGQELTINLSIAQKSPV